MRFAYVVVVTSAGLLACERSTPGQPSKAVSEARDSSLLAAPAAKAAGEYPITAEAMASIRLGMTLDEARRALPSAKFARTSDGEGVALVEVTLAPETSVMVFAGEDDPAASIDWSKKIRMIETFSPAFQTAEGVHAGSRVVDVAKRYGTISGVDTSEIEQRQYIKFHNQPAALTFRVDYAGMLPDGSQSPTPVDPSGVIQSIAISSSNR